jgi:hypothetical protein
LTSVKAGSSAAGQNTPEAQTSRSADDPAFTLVNDDAEASSDHRLVWVDIALPGTRCR